MTTTDLRIPTARIDWILGRTHVATPDSEVEASVRRRLPADIDPDLASQIVRYALSVHASNRAMAANF